MHDGKGADQRDRYGDQGNDRGPPGLEKHDDHQGDGFDQSVHDGVDRTAHEHGGIIGDVVVDAFRKALLELHHFGAYGVGYGDGIAARTLEYRDGHRRAVIDHGTQGVIVGAELHSADIAQARYLSGRAGFDDDALEVGLVGETALGVDLELEISAVGRRRRAQLPGGHLHILFAYGVHHIAGGEATRGHFFRIQPDSHRVVAAAEALHIAHPVEARELILDAQRDEIREIGLIVAIVRRVHEYRERDVRR